MLAWVTGGTGFVGSALIRRLVSRGDRVVALIRPTARARVPEGADVVLGVLPDVTAFADRQRPDVVFHCAAVIDGSPDRMREVNVEATTALAACARGARFVHVSTTDVYPRHSPRPVSETTPPRPFDAYGRTKLQADERLLAMRPDAIILRLPGIYGPASARCVVTRTARRILAGTFFGIGDGSAVRSWVYVENVVDALLHVAAAESARGIYLVDDGTPIARAELTREVARTVGRAAATFPSVPGPLAYAVGLIAERAFPLVGKEPPLTVEGVRYAQASLPLDTTRLRDSGFSPRFTTAQGIRQTLAWVEAQGLLRPRRSR